ncbi:hypothetical protein NQ176_g3711 [Zarea fungicola]|uniref:Uncharacterized protein n=1 Tax=Zarea fungicola TaxID=93591 RepID=A0ACC1NHU9_9HYPO|nr:hypothetical protein NQ176_g3711 [Lecanicillium fungicola]
MASQKGRCNCGSITLSLAAVPTQVVICHCLNCRKAGGPYSMNYVIDENEDAITDSKNTLRLYEDRDTISGNLCERYFCSGCGSAIYSATVVAPGKRLVKASLFDSLAHDLMEVNPEHRVTWD